MHKIVSFFPGDPAECLHTSDHHLYNSRLSIRRSQKALANAHTGISKSQAAIERTDVLLRSIRKKLVYSPFHAGPTRSE